jgi:hypothetical protein
MIDYFGPSFLVFILPALSAGTLVLLKFKGAHVSWIGIAGFSIWFGLTGLLYLMWVGSIAASAA